MKLQSATEKILIDCLLITLAIFIPYSQVAQHRFIEFDDGIYAFQNTFIIQGLTWDSLVWAFTNTDTANWHPITWITHLIDREIFGPHAGGYLLMNVAWHTAASCLCYVAFLRCTKKRLFALTVALIFALHPANVENVAWTSERKSLVDAFFWFLGTIAYLDYIETKKLKFLGIVFITHLLGLMAKPMNVTFPCTLVLVHLLYLTSNANSREISFQEYRQTLFTSLKSLWPLLLLSGYFSLVTASAQTMAMSSVAAHPVSARIINALQAYEAYVRMFFNPGQLAPFYPLFMSEPDLAKAMVSLLLLGCITLLFVFFAFKKQPVPLLGWLWFLGTMVPVIGLVQVGAQSHADRYLYIPMIGLAFVFPALFDAFAGWKIKSRQFFQSAWLAATALALTLATNIQVSYWKDGVSLFKHALQVTGDCVTSVNCLTCAYLRLERYSEAIAFLESKILVAKNPSNISKFHSMMSQAQLMLGKYDAAVESATQSISEGRIETINYWVMANAYYKLNKPELATQNLNCAKALLGPLTPVQLNDRNMRDSMTFLEAAIKVPLTSSSSSTSVH